MSTTGNTYLKIDRAAMIYRAMKGDEDAQGQVRVEDVQQFVHGETFDEFLRLNHIITYEETVR
jgi:hypothetical protein